MQVSLCSIQDHAEAGVLLTPEFLGVEKPSIPGDVMLCGSLPKEMVAQLASGCKAWIYLNMPEDPNYFPEEIKAGGAELAVCPFPACTFPMPMPPPMPSDQDAESVLKAIDELPRPLIIQCSSGNRAGAALLLWLANRKGYSMESARQLATDEDLQVWTRCSKCGPMRSWLLARMPTQDAAEVKTMAEGLTFCQLFDPISSTFTYLLGCPTSVHSILFTYFDLFSHPPIPH